MGLGIRVYRGYRVQDVLYGAFFHLAGLGGWGLGLAA